jgi:hypothetical protein
MILSRNATTNSLNLVETSGAAVVGAEVVSVAGVGVKPEDLMTMNNSAANKRRPTQRVDFFIYHVQILLFDDNFFDGVALLFQKFYFSSWTTRHQATHDPSTRERIQLVDYVLARKYHS